VDVCAQYGECSQVPYVLVDGRCDAFEIEARSAWTGFMLGSVGVLLIAVVLMSFLSRRRT
jgi:hypothetical protein